MIREKIKYNDTVKTNSREIIKLKKEFPGCFDKDGNFLIDRLINMLSKEDIDIEREGYELQFLGKSYAKYITSTQTTTVLTPDIEHNEKPENKDSENLYIVGDNLNAIKHLLNSYSGQIKCIYIDPPYNTGSDGFVYPDNFKFTKEGLSNTIGIEEDEAERILNMAGKSTHSAWMTFMYPRLMLARDLLSDDGVIFISIDDNEQSNLKLICDEIFGESNFVACISNINNPKGRSDDKFIATAHEYLIVYTRDIQKLKLKGFEPTEKIIRRYNKIDTCNRKYREIDLRKTGENDLREDRPNLFYYFLYNEDTGDFYPSKSIEIPEGYIQIKPQRGDGKEGNWRWSIDTATKKINCLKPKFMPNRKVWSAYEKDYLDSRELVKATTAWTFKDVNSERGTEDFINLGLDKKVFPKPKPLGTISRIIKLSIDENDIILDFFSGSATTAHAVMKLNAEDNGNRKYIMVQLPEVIEKNKPAYEAGYRTIDEIGRTRIEKAAAKIKEEIKADIDYGYKLYRLNEPSDKTLDKIVEFNPYETLVLDDMTQSFEFDNIPGRDTILSTWLNMDGYGLTLASSKIRLNQYEGDLIKDSLYIIDPGLATEDVMELIKKIEEGFLNISRIVLYPYSVVFNVVHELKKNIVNLRNNKNINVIERY